MSYQQQAAERRGSIPQARDGETMRLDNIRRRVHIQRVHLDEEDAEFQEQLITDIEYLLARISLGRPPHG